MSSFLVDNCPHCGKTIQQRGVEQSNAFHAICHDFSQQLDWPRGSGVKIDTIPWKRLLIAAWERTHGRRAEIYPALDGQGFDVVYRRSSRLSKHEMSELIEFARAWGAENGAVLREEAA